MSSNVAIFSDLQALRNSPETATVSWLADPPADQSRLFAGFFPDRIDMQTPLAARADAADGVRQSLAVAGLDPLRRYYFRPVSGDRRGPVVAPRQVRLEGAYNFRDLGGYPTGDGRRIRWGQAFRSDGLHRLTEPDRDFIGRMNVALIIDLRSSQEAGKSPDRLPRGSDTRHELMPVQTGELNFLAAMERLKKGDDSWMGPDFMVRGYLKNLTEFAYVWAGLIRKASDPENRPFIFHCTGGKDRAGTAAAMLLLALGCSRKTVVDDHQLSNVYIAEMLPMAHKRLESMGVDPHRLRPYLTAPLEGITALLDRLEKEFGDVEHYLTRAGGLEKGVLERLREGLLED